MLDTTALADAHDFEYLSVAHPKSNVQTDQKPGSRWPEKAFEKLNPHWAPRRFLQRDFGTSVEAHPQVVFTSYEIRSRG